MTVSIHNFTGCWWGMTEAAGAEPGMGFGSNPPSLEAQHLGPITADEGCISLNP